MMLSVMTLLMGVTLRFARLKTPTLHRIAWCMVLLAGWLALSTSGAGVSARPLMTASDLAAVPRPAPDHRLQYGPIPLNFGEIRLPAGPGPPTSSCSSWPPTMR